MVGLTKRPPAVHRRGRSRTGMNQRIIVKPLPIFCGVTASDRRMSAHSRRVSIPNSIPSRAAVHRTGSGSPPANPRRYPVPATQPMRVALSYAEFNAWIPGLRADMSIS
jgi:hypothetical protein